MVAEGTVITGEFVVLREKREDDAEDDYAWRVDEDLSGLDATVPIRMTFEQFSRYHREEVRYPNPWSRKLAIDTLDGRHIGNCMYYDIDLARGRTELGIMIGDKAYWSHGYGADAVAALVCHIFTETSISLIYLHTLEWNHRARKSFAKCGFQEIRHVRRGGHDFVRMELGRAEWEVRRPAGDELRTRTSTGTSCEPLPPRS